jgi:hypothetical protein
MSGLPTPPMEDQKSPQHVSRRPSKPTKHSSRTSKRTASSHEHGPVAIDGRHKRVWKACERCRMKKTKVLMLAIGRLYFFSANFNSVTENRRVKDVRMMVWYVQQEAGKRQNLNSYREGKSNYTTYRFHFLLRPVLIVFM